MRCPELKNICLTLWAIRKTSFLFHGHVEYQLISEEARRSVSHSSTSYTTSTGGYSGGMSLHELNNRLERYITQIQLNPGDPQVSINVDRIR